MKAEYVVYNEAAFLKTKTSYMLSAVAVMSIHPAEQKATL